MGDEQGDQKPGSVKSQCCTICGGHVNDGIDTVNIEKEGKKE